MANGKWQIISCHLENKVIDGSHCLELGGSPAIPVASCKQVMANGKLFPVI